MFASRETYRDITLTLSALHKILFSLRYDFNHLVSFGFQTQKLCLKKVFLNMSLLCNKVKDHQVSIVFSSVVI